MSRLLKFRAWDGKRMNYDDRDAGLWHGLLVAEGDTILMQFTGRTDRNGKEIYEGDILFHEDIRQWPKNRFGPMTAQQIATYPMQPIVVEWNADRAGYDPFVSENDEGGPYFYSERIEVIGNIHEHPQLLRNIFLAICKSPMD